MVSIVITKNPTTPGSTSQLYGHLIKY